MFNMKKKKDFLFDKSNYKYVIIGILFIIIGFLLMLGGGSKDPDIFTKEIYNFQRIRLNQSVFNGFRNTKYRSIDLRS